jgi:dienelactone hydrolase
MPLGWPNNAPLPRSGKSLNPRKPLHWHSSFNSPGTARHRPGDDKNNDKSTEDKTMIRTNTLLTLSLAAALFAADADAGVQDVSFTNGQNITLTGKLYQPTGAGPFPAVILMHGCSGMYSYSDPARGVASLYKEWATRLNNAGYAALLIDSFGSRGAPQNQCGNGSAGTSEVNDRPYDAAAAAQFLSIQSAVDPAKIGALGWSHGGSSVFATMDRLDIPGNELIKAGVSFYPGCGLYGAFGGISTSTWMPHAPLLVLHGTADALYQSGYCTTRIDRAKEQGASVATGNPVDMTAYFGAQHSFDQAKAGDSKWTQADLNAKQAADPTAVLFFDTYLK